MKKDDLVYVGHMLDTALMVIGKVRGKSRADFDGDENLRLALAHLIQTIGEAARRVSDDFQNTHSKIPWRKIIGTRHKVIHDYLHVNYDIVWDIVTVDLPPLIAALEKIVPPDENS